MADVNTQKAVADPAVGDGTKAFAIAATKMDEGFAHVDALQDNGPVVQTANDDDDDEYKSDASEGYSSDGSVYIDEGAESSDGSDEDENGDITDDNSDFEQEEGLVRDGNDIDEEDDANEGNLTESSESEEEVESPAQVNKTGRRNLEKAPSSAKKTPASRVRSGRVIKSRTAASGTPLKCPVQNCDKTFTGKNPRQCLWQHLRWYATCGLPERAAFAHAHSVAHEQMKREAGKSYSHMPS
jgi:hypothetical protein